MEYKKILSQKKFKIRMDKTEEIYEKKGINIGNTDSINELIKAIYRELR